MWSFLSGTTQEIAASVIASLLIFMAGYVVRVVTTRRRHRHFRKFWKSFAGDNKLTIVFSVFKRQERILGSEPPIVTLPLANALTNLVTALNHELPDMEIGAFPGDELPQVVFGGNVVSIGGPYNNPFTKMILERLGNPIAIHSLSDRDYKVTIDGNEFMPRFNETELSKDFGYIFLTPNPFNLEKNVCILFGIHSYGLLSAANSFLTPIAETILTAYQKRDPIVIVVKSEVAGEFVGDPELITQLPIRPA